MDRRGKWKSYLLFVFAGAFLIGATPERTIYSNTSNKELKPRVMRLVKNIRELGFAYRNRHRELLAAFDKRDNADEHLFSPCGSAWSGRPIGSVSFGRSPRVSHCILERTQRRITKKCSISRRISFCRSFSSALR